MSQPRLLHEFVTQPARHVPTHIAIDIPPSDTRPQRHTLTYQELTSCSQRWARVLSTQVQTEDIVAILLPRHTPLLVVAQLAILQAGGAYTCLDPSFPPERMAFILRDANVKTILTTPSECNVLRNHLPQDSPPDFLDVSTVPFGLETIDDNPQVTHSLPNINECQLAYVIYTSGTTGKPKGVCIEHRNIVHLIQSDIEYFGLSSDTRVAQSSSAAYDSSLEELYLALACGGTAVVLDDETVRLGPDLIPWLQRERIHVLCPPPTLLRTTLCDNPEQALPDLSLLYVGGEALTPDIADKWAKNRWMENGYGPTECTVTVVRGPIQPNEPITIGQPVKGNTAWIFNENLDPVPTGTPGELCISGAGVARGYLNRPTLTAERFHEHPQAGRIYRTGDLVQETASGDLLYLGRIDTQVKLRGYRIELEAIESTLCKLPEVQTAACTVQGEAGNQQLIAFVVLLEDTTEDVAAWKQFLGEQLPSYMVPTHIVSLPSLPTSPTSGKLDRKSLPTVELTHERTTPFEAPVGPVETHIANVLRDVLGLKDQLSRDDAFFAIGGNSVLAAKAISALRTHPGLARLTVRDLYNHPTVAGLATHHQTNTETTHHPTEWVQASLLHEQTVSEKPRPILSSLCQMGVIGTALVSWSAVGYGIGFHVFPWLLRTLGVVPFLLVMPLIGLALAAIYIPLSIGLAVGAKRLLIGTYQPGRYPVWGSFYLRNWIVQRFVNGIPWGLFGGTIFKNQIYRWLGANIGNNVHIHNGVSLTQGGWDLLTIGDGATIGRDAALRLVSLQEQHMVVGPISVGRDATLDTRAGLPAFSVMEDQSALTPLSTVTPHTTIPQGEQWDGVPATSQGKTTPAKPPTTTSHWHPTRHGWMLLAARFGLGYGMALPGLALTLGLVWYWQLNADKILQWLFSPTQFQPVVLLWLAGLLVGGSMAGLVLQALLMRALGPVPTGTHPRWSPFHIKWWLKTQMLEAAGNTLSGTMFWPSWLRLAGMNIGPQCEISSIMEVIPEHISIGQQSFFADGIYLGTAHFHRGTFTCSHTTVSSHTFLGNHCILPGGVHLPEGILLGVCTVADDTAVTAGSSWFGHPAFLLPQREIVEADQSVTFRPSAVRWWNRFFWEAARFALPLYPMLLVLLWFKTLPLWQEVSTGLFLGLIVPAYSLGIAGALCGLVWLLKWLLLGKSKPGQHPLWSCWCSRWDFLYVAWGAYARGVLAPFEETLWLAWWLRVMGVRVGKRVVLGAGFAQVVDPDMLHFEDDATVACNFQAHSFEDRVLKMDHVHLRTNSSTTAGAVVMYGADIQPGAYVGAHSVVMKQEQLPAQQYHMGCPTRSLGDIPETTVTLRPHEADNPQ